MRVVRIDLKKNVVVVGRTPVSLSQPQDKIQEKFYEAYQYLDDKDRYIATLEILVDHLLNNALPTCLNFLIPEGFGLSKGEDDQALIDSIAWKQ